MSEAVDGSLARLSLAHSTKICQRYSPLKEGSVLYDDFESMSTIFASVLHSE